MSEKQALNRISEEIISTIAMNTVLEVPGVNHLSDSFADNITKKIVGKNDKTKGIKVSKDKEDLFVVDIHIVADYGYNIPQLAWDIQSSVKKHVTKAINQKIGAVNIHIEGVSLPKNNGR